MIDPKELRIGNWVYAYPKRVISVIEITKTEVLSKDDESEEPFSYNELEGIPLTPEILEKCGFEKNVLILGKEGVCSFDWHLISYNNVVNLAYDYDDCAYYSHNAQLFYDIKYLHQLQNVYFALTGKEITANHKALSLLH